MSGQSVATSVRIPEELQQAAKEAVANGLARSLTELIVDGLRERLVALATEDQEYADTAAVRAALEDMYVDDPASRPTLAEIVTSAAMVDDHPAQHHPDLIAEAIAALGDDAFIEDVYTWIEGALSRMPAAS